MTDENKMTALGISVGADKGQSHNNLTNKSITDKDAEINDFLEKQREQAIQEYLQLHPDPSRMGTMSQKALMDTPFEQRLPIIDGLLYSGAYLIAGPPKIGKSFLMGQLAYHVSTGTPLWGFPVRQGTVLYLALEDDYGRLQSRMYRMFGASDNTNLFFSISANQMNNGLNDQLSGFLRNHPETSLIIIDTLQKVREANGDQYSYSNDYQAAGALKAFADAHGICLIAVHHTRKQKSDDAFDMVSGTNGLNGAVDGTFVLQKEKRTSRNATLEVAGRDQPNQKIYLMQNEESLCWELDHVETELWKEPPEPVLEQIAKRITEESPEWVGTPSELCEFLSMDMKANALTQKLNVHAGRLLDEYGIRYWNKRTHAGRQIGLRLERRDDA